MHASERVKYFHFEFSGHYSTTISPKIAAYQVRDLALTMVTSFMLLMPVMMSGGRLEGLVLTGKKSQEELYLARKGKM